MQKIRAVLFDYDDTLVKTRECKFAALMALAERYYGRALTTSEIEAHWGIPYRALFARLFEQLDSDLEQVIQRYEALNDEFPIVPYEDTLETLATMLDRGQLVGVVTSAGEIVRRQMVTARIPLERLSLLQTAGDSEHHKPDPRVFTPALARLATLGVRAEDTLYVGDSLNDWRAAHGAGLRFVGVHGRTTPEADFKRAGVASVGALRELTESAQVPVHM